MAVEFHTQSGKLISVVAANMPAIPGEDMQYWIENPKLLQKALSAALIRNQQAESCLRFNTNHVWPAVEEAVEPTEFFQSGDGLYVGESFKRLILPHLRKVTAPAVTVSSYELVQEAADSQIRKELPIGHVFADPSQFGAYLIHQIKCQRGGKDGALLNNGYWNISYVQVVSDVLAVYVNWDDVYREWLLYAWELGGYRWPVGDRVFSRAAAA